MATLDLPGHVVMENVFKCIDPSIFFPNSETFRNFKRKFTSSSKNKCPDSVEEFYVLKNDIGPNCAAIGLSISVFDNILSDNYDDSTHKLKGGVYQIRFHWKYLGTITRM